jgi:hypothetical protein
MGVKMLQMGEKLQPLGGKVLPMRVQMLPVGVNVSSGQLSQSVDGTGKLPQAALALDAVTAVDVVR